MKTELERLTSLIEECAAIHESGFDPDKRISAEALAQYLLANGAVVMPCKTGDEVYRISKRYGKWVILPREVCCVTHSITSQNEIIWQLFTTTLDVLGVTVFLTREDAEAALERRKEKKIE